MTSADLMGLTRRIGDAKIYKYCGKSIGWPSSIALLVTTVAYAFAFNFLRKLIIDDTLYVKIQVLNSYTEAWLE